MPKYTPVLIAVLQTVLVLQVFTILVLLLFES